MARAARSPLRIRSAWCYILLLSGMFVLFANMQMAHGHGYHEHRSAKFTQPDGTVLHLRFHGSDYYARTETFDGYTVVFDPKTKTYYYAGTNADGSELLPTPHQAGKADPKALGLPKGVRLTPQARAAKIEKRRNEMEAVLKDQEKWESLKAANRNYRSFKNEVKKQEKAGKKGFVIPMGTIFPDSEIPESPQMAEGEVTTEGTGGTGPESAPPSFTLTEDVVGLTILVDFSDDPGTAVTQSQVDDWANKPGYTGFSNAGSVYDYFYTQSNGRLRYSNNVTYYVRVPQPRSYYDDTAKDSGLCGRLLLNDALDVLIADGYDFSSLTTKAGGNIRACNVFFAGADSGVWAQGLWPHRWVLSPKKEVAPGMYVYDYQITNIGTATDLKIGTFLHENGHMLLGYPDFYSYDGNAARIQYFSLMASGNHAGSGRHPTNLDSYMKEASGWMDVVDLTSASNQRCAVQVDGNLVYRYANPSNAADYFMWEVRDNTGWEGPRGGANNSVNPATGLLTWHVLESGSNTYSSIFTNQSPNADYTKPYELLVVEANPSSPTTPWYDDPTPGSNDAFSAATRSSITDSSTPSALKFWDTTGNTGRTVASNCEIHSISADGPSMTFVVGNGAPSGSPTVVLSRNNLYTTANFGTNAPTETFTICNGQGGTLSYSVSDNVNWLSCNVTTGTATTEHNTVTITFNTVGLTPGNHTGTITVTDGPSTQTITVNLIVFTQPTLAANPTSMSIGGIEGIASDPVSLDLNNIGGGSCNYTVSKTQPWLSLSHTSGTLVLEIDRIEVTCDATGLAPGTYNDTITISSSEASNSPLTVPVTFTVASSDMVVTSPNGGESFSGGGTETITWVSSLGGTVKIDLYQGGSFSRNIANNETNDGSYSWAVPLGLNGTDFRIQVSSIEQGTKLDQSDTDFAISSCSSFEAGLDGWVQSAADDMDWSRNSGSTPSASTGPTAASDGSYYLYMEASSPNFPTKTAIIYKDLNFAGINQPLMSFDYHMYGSTMGTLYVEVSTNGGSSWNAAEWSLTGDQGNAWVTGQTVNLGAYAGQTVRIRFRGITGDNYFSDMSIDNVCFTEGLTAGVQFVNGGEFTVDEAAGTATITVERLGDTSGSASVSYATSNGTATSGGDYNTASGTLSWGVGDAADKTFTVAIINDTGHETLLETVNLTLSNPVGTSILGSNPGTLSIQDNDNQLPSVYAGEDKTMALSENQPWTPADIATALWLDADDAGTVTLNGSTVSQWNDKSGNARHATQTTGGNQPTNTAGGLNSRNVLAFDGTSDFMNVNLDFLSGVSHSAFIVTSNVTGYTDIYGAANGSAGANSIHVGFNGNTRYRMNYWGHDWNGTISPNFQASGSILNYVWDVGSPKQIYANGKTEGTGQNALAPGAPSGGGRISNVVGHGYYGGHIGEIIFLTGAVSTADREKVEGYLAHKWGLTANLDAGHPYKNDPPGGAGMLGQVVLDDATASDPDSDPVATTWSLVTGPAAVSFDDASALNATATFTQDGTYTLRLTGTDGRDQHTDDVIINVDPPTLERTVSYNGNGNTGGAVPVDSNSPYQTDDTVTVLGNTGSLTKTGHGFAGWNTAANGSGDAYLAGNTFAITSNTTLYAQWTPNTYTVTFDKQSGSGGSNTVLATYGTGMPTATPPTRTGYAFGGYFTAAGGSGTQYYDYTMASTRNWDLTANTTLYAKWTAAYTVNFQTDGTAGASLTGDTSQVVPESADCSAVTANAPAGHYFVNWTNGGSPYSTNNPLTVANVTGSLTLVANFAITPTITITDDGSLIEGAENGEIIMVTLSNGVFADPITPGNWTVTGLPAGVSKGTLTRLSDSAVSIALSGNRTVDYDSDITNVSVSCTAAEITAYGSGLSSNSGVVLKTINDAESIEIADDGWIEEGSENGELITVILHGGTFAPSLNASNWTLSNLPAGVSKGAVTRINEKVVTIALTGNRTGTYGGNDITNVTVSCSTTQYADSAGGSVLSVSSGVTLRALNSGTIILQNGLNAYTGTEDTHIYKGVSNANFSGEATIDLNSQKNQTRHGLLRFNLADIPAGSNITAATLDFTAGGANIGSVEVYNTTAAWNVSTATWDSANGIGGTTLYGSAAMTNGALGQAVPTISIAPAIIQGWIDNPATNNGFSIRSDYSSGNSSAVLSICSADHGNEGYRPKLTITYASGGGSGPEMTVQGQGRTINNGDTTPSTADDTHFGEVATGGSTAAHTFTVNNDGDATLSLNGTPVVDITGANAGDFSVTAVPSTTVAAGGSTTFEVTFNPGSGGVRTATVSIASDDSDEAPYTFAVTGVGVGAATTYTVTYDGNAHTGGSAPVDGLSPYDEGSSVTVLGAGTLVKSNNGFKTWNTASNGTGVSYAPGASFTINADITLYAIWNGSPVADAGSDQAVSLTASTPWAPSELTTDLWLDADDAGTISLSGSDVTQWDDKSGNSRHATQTNSSIRPTSGTRTLGGKNIIDFNAATQSMVMPSIDVVGKEVWSVFLIDDYTADASMLILGGGGNVQIGINSSSQNMRLWAASNPFSGDTKSTGAVAQSAGTVAGWLAHTDTKKYSLNGTLQTTSDSYVSGSMTPTSIGRGQYAVMDGAIGEIVITSGALSTQDRQKMEGYLAHKWGLEGNLPGGHPYETTPPGGSGLSVDVDLSSANVTDPESDSTTATWSVLSTSPSGLEGSVSFDNVNLVDATATFTAEGQYTLRLSVTDGYSTSTDEVVITVGPAATPYQTWAQGTFANTFSVTDANSDPDGDGRANFVEFAFGTDPTIHDGGPLAYVSDGNVTAHGAPLLEGPGGGYKAVFLRRKDHVAAGLTYDVQFTAELGAWTTDNTGLSVVTGDPSTGDYEAVSVPYPASVPLQAGGNAAPKFFRVSVTME